MSYLDQLKKSFKVPAGEPKETKELPRPNCLGFLGSPLGVFEKIEGAEPANDPTRTAWRWLLHFGDRNPLEVAFSPPASHAEVLADYPDALAAEPIEDDLGGDLARNDTWPADGMRFCTECSNLRGGVCGVAKPGGIVSAVMGFRPALGILLRCAGYSATAGGNDQRPGRECLAPMAQEVKHAD